MFADSPAGMKIVFSILLFPLFFQEDLIRFAWAAGYPTAVTVFNRVFILIPALSFILACWVTIAGLASVLVRQRRGEFMIALLVTWWDYGRTLFAFWGGAVRFLFHLVGALYAVGRVLLAGLWALIQDVFFFPLRLVRSMSENMLAPGVPWLAVGMTVVWSLIEAALFTWVATPLVIDTFANMTGSELSVTHVRIPLFFFMLIIVLGSYAVLSTWVDAVKSKDVAGIIKITLIEFVTLFVEVVFLYREFVEALAPWFAERASGDFELGITGTLLIAGMAWLGIRAISWFLFASHGTPLIMAVIRGTGVKPPTGDNGKRQVPGLLSSEALVSAIQADLGVFQKKGDEILGAFLIPPLQVVACAINFCTLLFTGEHLFRLPFKSMDDVMDSRVVLHGVGKMKLRADTEDRRTSS